MAPIIKTPFLTDDLETAASQSLLETSRHATPFDTPIIDDEEVNEAGEDATSRGSQLVERHPTPSTGYTVAYSHPLLEEGEDKGGSIFQASVSPLRTANQSPNQIPQQQQHPSSQQQQQQQQQTVIRRHPSPELHFQVLRLAHPGVQMFFKHLDYDPHFEEGEGMGVRREKGDGQPKPMTCSDAVDDAVQIVLNTLYPPPLNREKREKELKEEEGSQSLPHYPKPNHPLHYIPPPIRSLTLYLEDMEGVAWTKSTALDRDHKEVHFSTNYIRDVATQGDSNSSSKTPNAIAKEIKGVLVHEFVHAFQYDGTPIDNVQRGGTAPGGLIEGIADWVRIQAGLETPNWMGQDLPQDWDQGYEKTAYFLIWLSERLKNPYLVPTINETLRTQQWDNGSWIPQLCSGQSLEKWFDLYLKEKRDEGEQQARKKQEKEEKEKEEKEKEEKERKAQQQEMEGVV